MVEWMLSNVVCHEFDKVVGKDQHESRRAMHVGFHMSMGKSTDQYRVKHLWIYGPCNYVHVAMQEERICRHGNRKVGLMEHLCYHDSCWRDAVQKFIFDNRGELSGFGSFDHLFDWYDVVILTEDEREYLYQMVRRRDAWNDAEKLEKIAEKLKVNPFDRRSLWKRLVV